MYGAVHLRGQWRFRCTAVGYFTFGQSATGSDCPAVAFKSELEISVVSSQQHVRDAEASGGHPTDPLSIANRIVRRRPALFPPLCLLCLALLNTACPPRRLLLLLQPFEQSADGTTDEGFVQDRVFVRQVATAVAMTSDDDNTDEWPLSPDMLSTSVRSYVEGCVFMEVTERMRRFRYAPECMLHHSGRVHLLREDSFNAMKRSSRVVAYGIQLKRLGTLVRTQESLFRWLDNQRPGCFLSSG